MAEVLSVKKICRVCPEGQKLTGASIELDMPVEAKDVDASYFEVEGRNITDVYVSGNKYGDGKGEKGNFLIVSLNKDDPAAVMADIEGKGPGSKWVRRDQKLVISMVRDSLELKAFGPVEATEEIEPLVDQFTQHVFCATNGKTIPYNLFVPADYDPEKKYPLVMYIHDRGPLSEEVKTTLRQGVGALSFITEAEQKKHPCIVLAPQFRMVPDKEEGMIDAIFELYEDIIKNYSIDEKKLYTTGQSMGGMTSIYMATKRPHFFTAFYLVACQWDADEMSVLHDAKMFIVVSRGDPRAYSGMLEAFVRLRANGAVVAEAEVDQEPSVSEEQIDLLRKVEANIRFAVLKTDKRDITCHMDTWQKAYDIAGIHDWLFEQSK